MANGSVDRVDVLGLWSNLERSSRGRYWFIMADADGESLSDLTSLLAGEKLHLDPSEALGPVGWLREGSLGLWEVDEIKACHKYRGPNTVHLTYGDIRSLNGNPNWYWRWIVHGDSRQMGRALRRIGFYVDDHWGMRDSMRGMTLSEIKDILQRDFDDIAAWGHTGHGQGPHPYFGGSPATGKLSIWNGSDDFELHTASSFSPRWKLSYIMQWACYAGLQPWGTYVAPGGSVYAEDRAIMPDGDDPFFWPNPIWTRP